MISCCILIELVTFTGERFFVIFSYIAIVRTVGTDILNNACMLLQGSIATKIVLCNIFNIVVYSFLCLAIQWILHIKYYIDD